MHATTHKEKKEHRRNSSKLAILKEIIHRSNVQTIERNKNAPDRQIDFFPLSNIMLLAWVFYPTDISKKENTFTSNSTILFIRMIFFCTFIALFLQ